MRRDVSPNSGLRKSWHPRWSRGRGREREEVMRYELQKLTLCVALEKSRSWNSNKCLFIPNRWPMSSISISYSVQLHLILKLYCAEDLEIIPFFYLKINCFYILSLWNQHGQCITPEREVDSNQEILFSFFQFGHQHAHPVAERALIFSYEEINSLIH